MYLDKHMYEEYTHQCLPSKKYRELLGTAIYVFNSNNNFIIETYLRENVSDDHNWYQLIDKTSGMLQNKVKESIIEKSGNTKITDLFSKLIEVRNRIIHSFAITEEKIVEDDKDHQILATKRKNAKLQDIITVELLQNFIEDNDKLSSLLHELRGF